MKLIYHFSFNSEVVENKILLVYFIEFSFDCKFEKKFDFGYTWTS